MLLSTLLFLFIYFVIPFREKIILQSRGWLYFISHYQMFSMGVLGLLFAFSLLIRGIIFACFFLDIFYLFFSVFFGVCLIPCSFDCIYYGLFNFSFFLETFIDKKKKVIAPNRSYYNRLLFLFVRCVFSGVSLAFFFCFYIVVALFWVLLIWSFLCNNGIKDFFSILRTDSVIAIFSLCFFLIPCMLELFYYGMYNRSFFVRYEDY